MSNWVADCQKNDCLNYYGACETLRHIRIDMGKASDHCLVCESYVNVDEDEQVVPVVVPVVINITMPISNLSTESLADAINSFRNLEYTGNGISVNC